jgi:hypothetical protein
MALGRRSKSSGSGGRILFPFLGSSISTRTLEASLRLAGAQDATLVPAYIATIPMDRSLEAPIEAECEVAMPLLETIEQKAKRAHVFVDSRIERSRDARHGLELLLEHERFDRIIVPAGSPTSEGFSPEDVAWLLENASAEVIVIRPAPPVAADLPSTEIA